MKNTRCVPIFGSILGAAGLLVLLFSSLSSVIAAPEVSISYPATPNGVTNDRWRILADMQIGRGDPGVVALNNKIHVVSGFFPQYYGYTDSQEVYDPLTNQWQQLWGFPMPRSDMVVANVGDKIYAIGGWSLSRGGVQDYNHMYDPAVDTWITMTSMITPVSGAGGVVLNDKIYIIGGYDGISDTQDVQIYDPLSDSWSIGTPMLTTRSEFEAVIVDGLIYAIGGTYNTSDVEIYDPVMDQWHAGPPLPDTRFSMAVVERGGNIYVIGGTDVWASDNVTNTTFVYNPTLGAWSLDDPMPTARRACDAAVISDTIYVIGGIGELGAGFANEAYADFEIISSTTDIVADDPDPSQAFQPFVISYQVTSAVDVPTGVVTVTVNQNDVNCTGQLVEGEGSCEITLDTPGTYTLTATYGGDSFHSASNDSERHIVIKAETTTTIISDEPDPSAQGKPILVTFVVASTFGAPTGVVTVTGGNGQQSCSDEITGGTGSCEITFGDPGTYTLTATYEGDNTFAASSDSTEHLVVDKLRLYIPTILRELVVNP